MCRNSDDSEIDTRSARVKKCDLTNVRRQFYNRKSQNLSTPTVTEFSSRYRVRAIHVFFYNAKFSVVVHESRLANDTRIYLSGSPAICMTVARRLIHNVHVVFLIII